MISNSELVCSILQQALSSCHLSSSDCVRLVVAIGSVLSVLPVSALLPPLEALVSGRVESLRSLAEQEPSELSKVELEKELAVLGALSHHVYPTLQEGERHPIFLLLLQLFPVLQSIINHWSSDYDVVEVSEIRYICVCNRSLIYGE